MRPDMNRDGLTVVAAILLGAAVSGFGNTPWWAGSVVSAAAILIMWLIERLIGSSGADVGGSDKRQTGEPDLRYVRRR